MTASVPCFRSPAQSMYASCDRHNTRSRSPGELYGTNCPDLQTASAIPADVFKGSTSIIQDVDQPLRYSKRAHPAHRQKPKAAPSCVVKARVDITTQAQRPLRRPLPEPSRTKLKQCSPTGPLAIGGTHFRVRFRTTAVVKIRAHIGIESDPKVLALFQTPNGKHAVRPFA